MLKTAFFILLIVHSLIHLFGFLQAFRLVEIAQLGQSISPVAGFWWLLASGLLLVTAGLVLMRQDIWWIFGGAALFLSQILIFQNWSQAKFGSVINLIILIPVLISFINTWPSSLPRVYQREVESRLEKKRTLSLLNEADINHLPLCVQKYLHFVGAVGKPRVINFRLVLQGEMKQKREGRWMKIKAEQYNFFDDNSRLFFLKSSLLGLPFDGFHRYVNAQATMEIRVASCWKIIDARGEKMDQSETVTFFNDLCLFAPAALINYPIRWEQIGPFKVKAKFVNQDITVTAILEFKENGQLVNFISEDRYLTENGKDFINFKWSTPIKEYQEVNGRKVPAYAEAIWHTPEGEFTYAQFYVEEIEYNLGKVVVVTQE